jgi:hypothetical protein
VRLDYFNFKFLNFRVCNSNSIVKIVHIFNFIIIIKILAQVIDIFQKFSKMKND